MFFAIGHWIARHWLAVTLFWITIVVVARLQAPDWNSVAYDGDLAYLPQQSASVQGEQWLSLFSENRSRSQVVLVFEQQGTQPNNSEKYAQWRIARDLQFLSGVALLEYALNSSLATNPPQDSPATPDSAASESAPSDSAGPDSAGSDSAASDSAASDSAEPDSAEPDSAGAESLNSINEAFEDAEDALNDAVYLDELLADRFPDRTPRLAAAYYHRSRIYDETGEVGFARQDKEVARALNSKLFGDKAGKQTNLVGLPASINLDNWVDVWTWRDAVFGAKLVSRNEKAKLIVVQLANEFLAVRNDNDLTYVHQLVDQVRIEAKELGSVPSIGVSGSAALGGDILRSAKESIRHTEWFTVVLVVLILGFVYRSPMLVIVPLLSIGVALSVSVALISLIASWSQGAEGAWWELRVFTTTRVFLVVILFGAGTDYCLFLISRYREELSKTSDRAQAIAHAMRGVGEALSASALTTIVGLGMMWFADFGKFRFSGPVIGLSLLVALVTCLTLTPAVLIGFTRILFWPGRIESGAGESSGAATNGSSRVSSRIELMWRWTADSIVRHPGRYLLGALIAMAPLAVVGTFAPRFTYDSLATLDASQPSRAGADIMRRYFSVGESSPITVLMSHPRADFSDVDDRFKIRELATALYEIADVEVVRSIVDPLGDFPPDRTLGLDRQALRTLMSRPHRRTSRLFLGNETGERTHAARVDVVVRPDPFSFEAAEVVGKIELALAKLSKDDSSFWSDTEFRLSGTTVGFRDLRQVTQSDTVRIRWLTVLAVYLVLIAITRRVGVSAYMIASVLLTYLVTLGAVWLLFSWLGGDNFQGLDWRVPLFLFVILVAIGQDYNVYLAMRVFEEQKNLGPIRGVREAVAKTGGIITSCGLVMAGTFFSMTATAWSPWLGTLFGIPGWASQSSNLSSIVQLGTALSFGVILDTFIVRSILLPSFLVLLCHLKSRRK